MAIKKVSIESMQQFLHNTLGWGYPDGLKEKDLNGYQDVYRCKYCDKDLAQDSTGSWFHLNN